MAELRWTVAETLLRLAAFTVCTVVVLPLAVAHLLVAIARRRRRTNVDGRP